MDAYPAPRKELDCRFFIGQLLPTLYGVRYVKAHATSIEADSAIGKVQKAGLSVNAERPVCTYFLGTKVGADGALGPGAGADGPTPQCPLTGLKLVLTLGVPKMNE